LIVAFAFAVLVPIVYFVYQYAVSGTSEVSGAQYEKLGLDLLAAAEQARGQGVGSWRTLDANLPDGVADITVAGGGSELVVAYETSHGVTDVVLFSDVNLSARSATSQADGTVFGANGPHSGRASFRVTAGDGTVSIAEWIPP